LAIAGKLLKVITLDGTDFFFPGIVMILGAIPVPVPVSVSVSNPVSVPDSVSGSGFG
jgi:hypothetical protein